MKIGPRSSQLVPQQAWRTARLGYRVSIAQATWHLALHKHDLLGPLALSRFESGNISLRLFNPIPLRFPDEKPHDAAAGPAQVRLELLGPEEKEPGLVSKADGTHVGILVQGQAGGNIITAAVGTLATCRAVIRQDFRCLGQRFAQVRHLRFGPGGGPRR